MNLRTSRCFRFWIQISRHRVGACYRLSQDECLSVMSHKSRRAKHYNSLACQSEILSCLGFCLGWFDSYLACFWITVIFQDQHHRWFDRWNGHVVGRQLDLQRPCPPRSMTGVWVSLWRARTSLYRCHFPPPAPFANLGAFFFWRGQCGEEIWEMEKSTPPPRTPNMDELKFSHIRKCELFQNKL